MRRASTGAVAEAIRSLNIVVSAANVFGQTTTGIATKLTLFFCFPPPVVARSTPLCLWTISSSASSVTRISLSSTATMAISYLVLPTRVVFEQRCYGRTDSWYRSFDGRAMCYQFGPCDRRADAILRRVLFCDERELPQSSQ